MKIALIDNYDSFTYNLKALLEECSNSVDVYHNDLENTELLSEYSHIVLSPGPDIPEKSGRLMEIISRYKYQKPLLGVCLGHQAIAQSEGYHLEILPKVYHGEISEITLEKSLLFEGFGNTTHVGRYHSWEVVADAENTNLSITATDEHGTIMAMEQPEKKLYGVQFHPESYMTAEGKKMIQNFLKVLGS